MLMKEICETCHLTKKAVEYYEEQGLIHPDIMENGYRNYGNKEVSTLKEIAVLRRCGLGIHDIRTILRSSDKSAALSKCKYLNELKQRKMVSAQQCLDCLISNYDVDKAFDDVMQFDDSMYTMQEKLALAFPGNYGVYLSLHFGRFLNEPIQTDEQRIAYQEIVTYLDDAKLSIPAELGEYLQNTFDTIASTDVKEIEGKSYAAIKEAMQNPTALLEDENTAAYVEYRLSDEYKNSPAGRLATLMVEFQKKTGYQEKLIDNLKRISPAYRQYCDEMADANKAFLGKFPEAERFF